jgi:hypothetical protein
MEKRLQRIARPRGFHSRAHPDLYYLDYILLEIILGELFVIIDENEYCKEIFTTGLFMLFYCVTFFL